MRLPPPRPRSPTPRTRTGSSSCATRSTPPARPGWTPSSCPTSTCRGPSPARCGWATRPSSTRAASCSRSPTRSTAAAAQVFERTRATGVDDGDPCRVRTDAGGEVTAAHVVIATHYPTLDRGLFFARLAAERSYAIGVARARARAAGHVPLDRVAVALGARDALRRRRAADRRRREPQGGDERPRRALRRARGVGARALRRRVGRVPLVGAGHDAGRRDAVRRQAVAGREAPVDRVGLQEVGDHERRGRRADARPARSTARRRRGSRRSTPTASSRSRPRRSCSRRPSASARTSSATGSPRRTRARSTSSRPARAGSSRHDGDKVAAFRDDDGRRARRLADLHPPLLPGRASTPPSARGTARATARASATDGTVLQGPAVSPLERKEL